MERYAMNRLIIASSLFALTITSAILFLASSKSVKKAAKTVRESAANALDDTLEKMRKGELTLG